MDRQIRETHEKPKERKPPRFAQHKRGYVSLNFEGRESNSPLLEEQAESMGTPPTILLDVDRRRPDDLEDVGQAAFSQL